jgi:hypothetical protein
MPRPTPDDAGHRGAVAVGDPVAAHLVGPPRRVAGVNMHAAFFPPRILIHLIRFGDLFGKRWTIRGHRVVDLQRVAEGQ